MRRPVPYLPTRSDVIGNCWYNPPPNQTTWATKSNLTAYHCLPILRVFRHIPGDDGQASEMIKYRIGEICRGPGLIWTYILLHWCAREGLTAVLWYATILPLTQLAENSCSFEAACTFSWPHFVLHGSWDRGGISCITVALPLCVFLWFHLYSLHYRGPSVWLGTTHSLTCQITSA